MNHEIHLSGFAFKIRPIRESDVNNILFLRTNTKLNSFIHPTSASYDDQIFWLSEYFKRQGDYYFAIEKLNGNHFEGLISIYNINNNSGEWGRWILKDQSLAAVESIFLILNCAFEILKIDLAYTRTNVENIKTVSLHDGYFFHSRKILKHYFKINGVLHDAIEHSISYQEWIKFKPIIQKISQKIATKING